MHSWRFAGGFIFMGTFWQDIKFGFRTLAKSPGFTALAIVALALGIGANTAIFSIADAFLLKPINIPDPEHLVVAGEMAPQQTSDLNSVAPANYRDWQEQAKSFEVMGTDQWDEVSLTGVGAPEKVQGFLVSTNFFEICSAQPMLGRGFVAGEDQSGNDNVVVLGENIWAQRFGADPKLVGQIVHFDGKPYTVIGVMPRKFSFPKTAELWFPMALSPADWKVRNNHEFMVLGKLKPGVSLESANSELRAISNRLAVAYPATNRGWSARVMDVRRFEVGDETRSYTVLLMGAVGFVLLIVCANVANLQFVRAASRQKEIAIRVALGGSRFRMVRQLLTESMITATAGAALGLVFAQWSIRTVLRYMPAEVAKFIPGWYEIRLDSRALLFTMLAAAVAGIMSGILPALQSSRLDVNSTLKEGGRSGAGGRGRHRLRNALVITQVTLATVLLIGAGLLTRGFRSLLDLNAGFQPESLLTMRVNLPDTRYAKPEQWRQFFDRALVNLSAIPGVQTAAETSWIPYGDGGGNSNFTIREKPWHDASEIPTSASLVISSNYLEMMHIPLLRGRTITAQDGPDTESVTVISQSLAKSFFSTEDPIGQHIKVGGTDSKNPWMTIVGVVGNVKMNWVENRPSYAFYRPYVQLARPYGSFALRTSGDPMALASAARKAISDVDSEEAAIDVMPMAKVISNSVIGLAYVSVMMGVMGMMALLLSAVGVYGVMAFTVTERTHEIGVRMALGAQPSNVLRLVVGKGVLLAGVGLLLGLPLGYFASRLLASLIYGVGSFDALTFGVVSSILVAVVILACWFPARRATRVDPMIALRYE
jgi:putative ABC transport system permease protein